MIRMGQWQEEMQSKQKHFSEERRKGGERGEKIAEVIIIKTTEERL